MLTRHILEAELVGEVLFQPLLDLQDSHVVVQLLAAEADAARSVAALYLVEDVAGYRLGDTGAAETLDQVDVEVAGRGDAASAIEVVGVRQMLVLVQQHLGEALGELAEEAPVGGRLLAVQQAGLGHPEHPAGLAADDAACGVAFAQPVADLWMARAQGIEVAPEGREYDDLCVVQRAVDGDAHLAEACHRQAVRAHQAGLEGRREAFALQLAEAQAGHVEEVLGLHQGGGEYAFDGKDADLSKGGGLRIAHELVLIRGKRSFSGWIVLFFVLSVQCGRRGDWPRVGCLRTHTTPVSFKVMP
ncbi:hypothetical protein D3C84_455170 [compost metagenome]